MAAVTSINDGRQGLATDGMEHQGRLDYEKGIAAAAAVFKEALATGDPWMLLLVEETFVEQELRFCGDWDKFARGSLVQTLQTFDDAFLSLEAVEGAAYRDADKTWPHSPNYRIWNYPKDAYHVACIAHRTRLWNALRAPGINRLEKSLLELRVANMTAATEGYARKQETALSAGN